MTGTALRVGICRASHRALLRCSAVNQKNIASLRTNISAHVAAQRPAVVVFPIGEADLENLEKAKEAAEKNKDDDFL